MVKAFVSTSKLSLVYGGPA